jgi:hypothetical protein
VRAAPGPVQPVSAAAMPLNVVTPLACNVLMVGAILAACASARAVRILWVLPLGLACLRRFAMYRQARRVGVGTPHKPRKRATISTSRRRTSDTYRLADGEEGADRKVRPFCVASPYSAVRRQH